MMQDQDRVLFAILKRRRDLALARDEHWYRIPVEQVHRRLKRGWPPQWVAFYQPQVFRKDACIIRYYSRVLGIREAVPRHELLPGEPNGDKLYHQLLLAPLLELPQPIPSLRRRMIIFILTTGQKFRAAVEINDLYDGSPLEERLWKALQKRRISAERREFVKTNGRWHELDFAIYCAAGKLNVEADGIGWHTRPEVVEQDGIRDRQLQAEGWRLLRLNTYHIREHMQDYCLPKIAEIIGELGGLDRAR
jgi:very-short-patch-repair endonuclease